MAPPSEQSPYRLLVEGPDDQYSVIHLMEQHGVVWDNENERRPYIQPEGGLPGLLKAIPVTLKSSAYERIGIILDANSDPGARWRQVLKCASKAGVSLPDSPDQEGTITEGRNPRTRVGVWLMPDNGSVGTLDHFLSRLVPPENPVWVYAGDATNEARQRGAPCREKDHAKSVLHTWLAWQESPGLPFGRALKAGHFETDGPEAVRFADWFRRLFL